MFDKVYTAMGTPNIALIKYWGKRDEKLILPMNSSISMTFDYSLNTVTSVLFSSRLKSDSLYINGTKQNLNNKDTRERFQIVNHMRRLAGTSKKVLVVSENSFPTSSGLASSASGTAALVYAVTKGLGLHLSGREMSMIARQGSGSACRSMFGGFVKWNKGMRADGRDSYAEQVFDENHWPELVDVIGVATHEKKRISSRAGMKQTVETSALYSERIRDAEKRVSAITKAIKYKDFNTLAEITMQDSNSMHAVMLDTQPPIMYLNEKSMAVINAVHEINEDAGSNIMAYTFDAGPNPQVITTVRNAPKAKRLLMKAGIGEILVSRAGHGPKMLDESKSLINERKLVPK